MEHKFKLQDQVILKRPILHGNGMSLIKLGTILAFRDGGKAEVSFPADRTRTIISLDQLEPVRSRYNRARVQVDPVRRLIGFMQ
jgi:hypothetical protein